MIRGDRLKGYYDRKRETMGLRTRHRYQETWLHRRGALPPSDASPQEKLHGQSPGSERFDEGAWTFEMWGPSEQVDGRENPEALP